MEGGKSVASRLHPCHTRAMARRSRRKRKSNWGRRLAYFLAAIPLAYLLAALVGSLIPVNRTWVEPATGETIYLISNGIHIDLILPEAAAGLDWRPLFPARDFARPDSAARWLAFGMGERKVYLDTPRWRDIRLSTIWAATVGGKRVMHVERISDPAWHAHAIRLRPEEYRRLWASIRAGFVLGADGQPRRIDHPGYGPNDAFYDGIGRASAINTCNTWAADMLRLAGIKVSLWSPFPQGIEWRYRQPD